MTMNKLQRHVHDLASAFGLTIVEKSTDEIAKARNSKVDVYGNGMRVVYVPPIVTYEVYAAALHEIGHAVHPTGELIKEMSLAAKFLRHPVYPRDFGLWLEQELSAWAWAERQALVWTVSMERFKMMALRSYSRPMIQHNVFKGADFPGIRDLARKCWPKEMHETRGAAEAQMRSIQKRGLEKDASRIHVYQCPHCQKWHVGHRKEAA